MAIRAGCLYAVGGRGGRPRQCDRAVAGTLTVSPADKQTTAELMRLCTDHLDHINTHRQGSIYRERSGAPEFAQVILE